MYSFIYGVDFLKVCFKYDLDMQKYPKNPRDAWLRVKSIG